jgi:hypothetical protein
MGGFPHFTRGVVSAILIEWLGGGPVGFKPPGLWLGDSLVWTQALDHAP